MRVDRNNFIDYVVGGGEGDEKVKEAVASINRGEVVEFTEGGKPTGTAMSLVDGEYTEEGVTV